MAGRSEDDARISDLFSAFGPVTVRRMFGGASVYRDGTAFAICLDGVIYLKADDESAPAFEREGLERFTYDGKTRRVALPYWRMPERLYDDPEELALWANEALKAALRSAAAKSRRAKVRSKSGRKAKA